MEGSTALATACWEDDPWYQSLLVRILPAVIHRRWLVCPHLSAERYVRFSSDPWHVKLLLPLLLPVPVRSPVPCRVPAGKIDAVGLRRAWGSRWLDNALAKQFEVRRYGTPDPLGEEQRKLGDYTAFLYKELCREDSDDDTGRTLGRHYEVACRGERGHRYLLEVTQQLLQRHRETLHRRTVRKLWDNVAGGYYYTWTSKSFCAHFVRAVGVVTALSLYLLHVFFGLSRFYEERTVEPLESSFPLFPARSPPHIALEVWRN